MSISLGSSKLENIQLKLVKNLHFFSGWPKNLNKIKVTFKTF